MKIDWDNIDHFTLTKNGNFVKGKNAYYLIEDGCKYCGDPYFTQRHIYNNGGGRFCSHSCSIAYDNKNIRSGKNHRDWSGNVKKLKVASYNTYESRLSPYGIKCRRNKENGYILEVRCYYCSEWFIPDISSVRRKISCIENTNIGENNLYCSDLCKYSCSTYRRRTLYKEQSKKSVQTQLREIVFERDGYVCQKCGSGDDLHCHHIEPVKINPIESADIDNCITLCKDCHKDSHNGKYCNTGYLSSC